MNERALAYLSKHSVVKLVKGLPEVMLPLDKLQGFLDLLGPGDLDADDSRFSYQEKLQRLYSAQATSVDAIHKQITQTKAGSDGTQGIPQDPSDQNRSG